MTFEQALERLAEKEPEKFRIQKRSEPWGDETYFETPYDDIIEGEWNGDKLKNTGKTQDDIDEILALIGWEYEVFSTNRTDKWWRYETWQLGGAIWIEQPKTMFPTKLEAAKAALIAVVEREYSL